MTILILFFALLVVGICILLRKPKNPIVNDSSSDSLRNFSDEDLNLAALNIVWPLPQCRDSFWGGSLAQCDEAQAECDALREKYKAYEPIRMRKQIMGWITYAERNIKKDRSDVISQKTRKDMDAYNSRCKKENNKTQEVLDALKNHE